MDPTTHYKVCPRCKQPSHLEASQCRNCGRQFRTQFTPQPSQPVPYVPPPQQVEYYQAPYTPHPYAPPKRKTDLCAVLANISGLLGFLAFGACFFGPAAVILGVVSLHRLKDNPELQGKALAWIGIALGVFCTGYAAYHFNQAAQALQQVGW